jgi:hypothetical protein
MHMITRGAPIGVTLDIYLRMGMIRLFVSPVCGPETLGVGMARVGQPTQKVVQVHTPLMCACVCVYDCCRFFVFFLRKCEDLLRKIKRPFERCDCRLIHTLVLFMSLYRITPHDCWLAVFLRPFTLLFIPEVDFGGPLHSLVLPGHTHEMEDEV